MESRSNDLFQKVSCSLLLCVRSPIYAPRAELHLQGNSGYRKWLGSLKIKTKLLELYQKQMAGQFSLSASLPIKVTAQLSRTML